jgi:hypothetical protein
MESALHMVALCPYSLAVWQGLDTLHLPSSSDSNRGGKFGLQGEQRSGAEDYLHNVQRLAVSLGF